ncbi:hypothetical protein RHMOL_Rhmol10G0094500 [Rhododendron molle]|uniref:Uncharacterized protein n=1 Tax=Rhododendron molle TaxID=49168 RepID=A0ACC0M0R3_RHOML|nr:hypothetical protein RHMOL_Rhmol10G0094500 [Rhododendron molle]
MEESLLLKNEDRKLVLIAPEAFVEELKKVTAIAAPMVVVTMTQYLLRVAPMIMVGHISELSLSSLAIATSLTNVTGYSVLFGMAGALETLCGQAYGAEQYRKLGTYTYGAILSLILSGLGTKGAALAISLSYWVDVIALGVYLKYSPACEKSRAPFSRDVFLSIGEFFHFALPSAGMVCLEWWSFELLVLLSGLLPNPELESSVLSICLTTTSLHSLIPYSIGAAASTRVSNELGAGNSRAAQLSVCTVMVLAVAEAIMVSAALFCCRFILGYAYSSEKEVVDYVREMTPLLCLSIVMDSLTAILSGIARGSGWQHIGAYVNFAAYYLVGIPLAIAMGFFQNLRGEGTWGGIVTGTMLQVIFLTFATCLTNWQEQANKARERIFKGKILADKLVDQLN